MKHKRNFTEDWGHGPMKNQIKKDIEDFLEEQQRLFKVFEKRLKKMLEDQEKHYFAGDDAITPYENFIKKINRRS